MGLFIGALHLDVLLIAGFLVTILLILRKTRWSRRTRLAVWSIFVVAAVPAFFSLFMPLVSLLDAAMTTEGRSVARPQYHGGYRIPAEASDITYHSDYGSTQAVFTIPEETFQRWVKSRGYHVETIEWPRHVSYTRLNIEAEVNKGYEVRWPSGQAFYDSATHRCYVLYAP